MKWFQQILDREVEKRGGNVAQLARDWGIDRTTIDKWRNGSDPRLPQVEKVLLAIGGDIMRALPDNEQTADESLRARLRASEETTRQLRHTLASLSSHLSQLARAIAPEAPTARLLREVIRDGSAPEVPLPTVLVDAPEPPPPQPKPKKKGTR
jgi:transposase-like protein